MRYKKYKPDDIVSCCTLLYYKDLVKLKEYTEQKTAKDALAFAVEFFIRVMEEED